MSRIIIGTAAGKSIGFDLDELLRTRLLITSDSGGGKSWLIRVLAEQLFGKVQVILIDPEGEFATLREKFAYALVGKSGETPADPRSAALVAQRLLELHASAVCDLYELKHHLRHQWVKLFLDALIEAPKTLWHPVVVIIDEVHVFCPEKGKGESEASQSVIDLSTRGRKRGYCAVWATQSLAKVNKDGSGMLQNRLIGPTFEDVNRKRAAELLGIMPHDQREFFHEMQMLAPGNFYAFGRAISKERVMVKIRAVETSHPEMGRAAKHSAIVPPTPDKIKALLPKLADLPKEAEDKARTEAEFRKEIRELHLKLKAAERNQAASVGTIKADPRQARTITQLRTAIEEAMKIIAKIKAYGFEAANVDPKAITQAVEKAASEISKMAARAVEMRQAEFEKLKREAEHVLAKLNRLLGEEQIELAVNVTRNEPVTISQTPRPSRPAAPINLDGITARQADIIRAAAQFHAVGIPEISKKWLAARSGASHKSSAYGNNLGALRGRGLIDYRNGSVFLTAAGIEAAGNQEKPLTQDEMAASCRDLLTTAQRAIFDSLYAAYPNGMNRDDLAVAANASPTSSAFGNNLGALRSAGMIDYAPNKTVHMQKWIFLEGAA